MAQILILDQFRPFPPPVAEVRRTEPEGSFAKGFMVATAIMLPVWATVIVLVLA